MVLGFLRKDKKESAQERAREPSAGEIESRLDEIWLSSSPYGKQLDCLWRQASRAAGVATAAAADGSSSSSPGAAGVGSTGVEGEEAGTLFREAFAVVMKDWHPVPSEAALPACVLAHLCAAFGAQVDALTGADSSLASAAAPPPPYSAVRLSLECALVALRSPLNVRLMVQQGELLAHTATLIEAVVSGLWPLALPITYLIEQRSEERRAAAAAAADGCAAAPAASQRSTDAVLQEKLQQVSLRLGILDQCVAVARAALCTCAEAASDSQRQQLHPTSSLRTLLTPHELSLACLVNPSSSSSSAAAAAGAADCGGGGGAGAAGSARGSPGGHGQSPLAKVVCWALVMVNTHVVHSLREEEAAEAAAVLDDAVLFRCVNGLLGVLRAVALTGEGGGGGDPAAAAAAAGGVGFLSLLVDSDVSEAIVACMKWPRETAFIHAASGKEVQELRNTTDPRLFRKDMYTRRVTSPSRRDWHSRTQLSAFSLSVSLLRIHPGFLCDLVRNNYVGACGEVLVWHETHYASRDCLPAVGASIRAGSVVRPGFCAAPAGADDAAAAAAASPYWRVEGPFSVAADPLTTAAPAAGAAPTNLMDVFRGTLPAQLGATFDLVTEVAALAAPLRAALRVRLRAGAAADSAASSASADGAAAAAAVPAMAGEEEALLWGSIDRLEFLGLDVFTCLFYDPSSSQQQQQQQQSHHAQHRQRQTGSPALSAASSQPHDAGTTFAAQPSGILAAAHELSGYLWPTSSPSNSPTTTTTTTTDVPVSACEYPHPARGPAARPSIDLFVAMHHQRDHVHLQYFALGSVLRCLRAKKAEAAAAVSASAAAAARGGGERGTGSCSPWALAVFDGFDLPRTLLESDAFYMSAYDTLVGKTLKDALPRRWEAAAADREESGEAVRACLRELSRHAVHALAAHPGRDGSRELAALVALLHQLRFSHAVVRDVAESLLAACRAAPYLLARAPPALAARLVAAVAAAVDAHHDIICVLRGHPATRAPYVTDRSYLASPMLTGDTTPQQAPHTQAQHQHQHQQAPPVPSVLSLGQPAIGGSELSSGGEATPQEAPASVTEEATPATPAAALPAAAAAGEEAPVELLSGATVADLPAYVTTRNLLLNVVEEACAVPAVQAQLLQPAPLRTLLLCLRDEGLRGFACERLSCLLRCAGRGLDFTSLVEVLSPAVAGLLDAPLSPKGGGGRALQVTALQLLTEVLATLSLAEQAELRGGGAAAEAPGRRKKALQHVGPDGYKRILGVIGREAAAAPADAADPDPDAAASLCITVVETFGALLSGNAPAQARFAFNVGWDSLLATALAFVGDRPTRALLDALLRALVDGKRGEAHIEHGALLPVVLRLCLHPCFADDVELVRSLAERVKATVLFSTHNLEKAAGGGTLEVLVEMLVRWEDEATRTHLAEAYCRVGRHSVTVGQLRPLLAAVRDAADPLQRSRLLSWVVRILRTLAQLREPQKLPLTAAQASTPTDDNGAATSPAGGGWPSSLGGDEPAGASASAATMEAASTATLKALSSTTSGRGSGGGGVGGGRARPKSRTMIGFGRPSAAATGSPSAAKGDEAGRLSAPSSSGSASPQQRSPCAFFDFSGRRSGLSVPDVSAYPTSNGYSVAVWLRVETLAPPGAWGAAAAAYTPYLYSLSTKGDGGCTFSAALHSGRLRLSVRAAGEDSVAEVDTVAFKPRRWYHVVVAHSCGAKLFGKSETVRVFVDGLEAWKGPLKYPRCGAATRYKGHIATDGRGGQGQTLLTNLHGQIASVYFIDATVSLATAHAMYELGPGYASNYSQADRPKLKAILREKAAHVYQEFQLSPKLYILFNPLAAHDTMLVNVANLSEVLIDASTPAAELEAAGVAHLIKGGTELCFTQRLHQVLGALGGVAVLLPLVSFVTDNAWASVASGGASPPARNADDAFLAAATPYLVSNVLTLFTDLFKADPTRFVEEALQWRLPHVLNMMLRPAASLLVAANVERVSLLAWGWPEELWREGVAHLLLDWSVWAQAPPAALTEVLAQLATMAQQEAAGRRLRSLRPVAHLLDQMCWFLYYINPPMYLDDPAVAGGGVDVPASVLAQPLLQRRLHNSRGFSSTKDIRALRKEALGLVQTLLHAEIAPREEDLTPLCASILSPLQDSFQRCDLMDFLLEMLERKKGGFVELFLKERVGGRCVLLSMLQREEPFLRQAGVLCLGVALKYNKRLRDQLGVDGAGGLAVVAHCLGRYTLDEQTYGCLRGLVLGRSVVPPQGCRHYSTQPLRPLGALHEGALGVDMPAALLCLMRLAIGGSTLGLKRLILGDLQHLFGAAPKACRAAWTLGWHQLCVELLASLSAGMQPEGAAHAADRVDDEEARVVPSEELHALFESGVDCLAKVLYEAMKCDGGWRYLDETLTLIDAREFAYPSYEVSHGLLARLVSRYIEEVEGGLPRQRTPLANSFAFVIFFVEEHLCSHTRLRRDMVRAMYAENLGALPILPSNSGLEQTGSVSASPEVSTANASAEWTIVSSPPAALLGSPSQEPVDAGSDSLQPVARKRSRLRAALGSSMLGGRLGSFMSSSSKASADSSQATLPQAGAGGGGGSGVAITPVVVDDNFDDLPTHESDGEDTASPPRQLSTAGSLDRLDRTVSSRGGDTSPSPSPPPPPPPPLQGTPAEAYCEENELRLGAEGPSSVRTWRGWQLAKLTLDLMFLCELCPMAFPKEIDCEYKVHKVRRSEKQGGGWVRTEATRSFLTRRGGPPLVCTRLVRLCLAYAPEPCVFEPPARRRPPPGAPQDGLEAVLGYARRILRLDAGGEQHRDRFDELLTKKFGEELEAGTKLRSSLLLQALHAFVLRYTRPGFQERERAGAWSGRTLRRALKGLLCAVAERTALVSSLLGGSTSRAQALSVEAAQRIDSVLNSAAAVPADAVRGLHAWCGGSPLWEEVLASLASLPRVVERQNGQELEDVVQRKNRTIMSLRRHVAKTVEALSSGASRQYLELDVPPSDPPPILATFYRDLLRTYEKHWRLIVQEVTGPRSVWAPVEGGGAAETAELLRRSRKSVGVDVHCLTRPRLVRDAKLTVHKGRAGDKSAAKAAGSGLEKIRVSGAARDGSDEEGDGAEGEAEADGVYDEHAIAEEVPELTAAGRRFPCEVVALLHSFSGHLQICGNPSRYMWLLIDEENACAEQHPTAAAVEALIERPKEDKFSADSVQHVVLRRHRMEYTAVEFFFTDKTSLLLNFASKEDAVQVMKTLLYQISPRPAALETREVPKSCAAEFKKTRLTERWLRREVSNFEYLMALNHHASRSTNDLTQYPVMPWILCDYTSDHLDLEDEAVYRDLSQPVGCLGEDGRRSQSRVDDVEARYESLESIDMTPYHYGSHYSNSGFVLHYLVRMEPYTTSSIVLQGGHFDHADRMFDSLQQTWHGVTHAASDVKELIPEFFYQPEMFVNNNGIDFGLRQDGRVLDGVELPPWAKSADDFVRIHREALESEHVSLHLHHWIDHIFGTLQGPSGKDGFNDFHPYSYEGTVRDMKLDAEEESVRRGVLSHVDNFGQTPARLFKKRHPQRSPAARLFNPLRTLPSALLPQSQLQKVIKGPIVRVYMATGDRLVCVGANGAVAVHTFRAMAPLSEQALSAGKSLRQSGSSASAFSGVLSGGGGVGVGGDAAITPPLTPLTGASVAGSDPATPIGLLAATQQAGGVGGSSSSSVHSILHDPHARSRLSGVLGGPPPSSGRRGYHFDPTALCQSRPVQAGMQKCTPTAYAYAVVALPERLLLFSSGLWDNTVSISELGAGAGAGAPSVLQTLGGHHDVVSCLAVSDDDAYLVTGSLDTTLRLYALRTKGATIAEYKATLCGHEEPVLCVAVNTKRDLVVSGSCDGTVILYNISEGKFESSLKHPSRQPVDLVSSTAAGSTVMYSKSDARLFLFTQNGGLLHHAEVGAKLRSLVLSHDARFLFCCGVGRGSSSHLSLRSAHEYARTPLYLTHTHIPYTACLSCTALLTDRPFPFEALRFIATIRSAFCSVFTLARATGSRGGKACEKSTRHLTHTHTGYGCWPRKRVGSLLLSATELRTHRLPRNIWWVSSLCACTILPELLEQHGFRPLPSPRRPSPPSPLLKKNIELLAKTKTAAQAKQKK